jgi:hypothetical protein
MASKWLSMAVGKRGKWLFRWFGWWGKVSIPNRKTGLVGENRRNYLVTGLPVTGYRFANSKFLVYGCKRWPASSKLACLI